MSVEGLLQIFNNIGLDVNVGPQLAILNTLDSLLDLAKDP